MKLPPAPPPFRKVFTVSTTQTRECFVDNLWFARLAHPRLFGWRGRGWAESHAHLKVRHTSSSYIRNIRSFGPSIMRFFRRARPLGVSIRVVDFHRYLHALSSTLLVPLHQANQTSGALMLQQNFSSICAEVYVLHRNYAIASHRYPHSHDLQLAMATLSFYRRSAQGPS